MQGTRSSRNRIASSRLARRLLPILGLGLVVLAGGCSDGTPARPHVLLVVVDTLRADHLGAYGHPRGLSPHIDALAAESVVFQRAYSPASYTLPSVVGLLTGRFPQSLGVHANISIFQGAVPTLAVLLRSNGWRTAAVVSNPVLEKRVGLHVGFDHYDDVRANRDGRATTDAALRWIDEHVAAHASAPFFLWMHYQDPHGPYEPPPGYRERYLAAERARPDGARELPRDPTHVGLGAIPRNVWVEGHPEVSYYRAGYAGEVQFVDEQLGRLLDHLGKLSLMDDTVVVFAADHGEAMGEGDYWFAHGERLTDPIVRVPLMIRVPGRKAEVRADVASLVDVLPTLASLLDLEPPFEVAGRDLLAPEAAERGSAVWLTTGRHATVAREGLVSEGYKYVVSGSDDDREEGVYRIGRSYADEQPADPDRLEDLRRALETLRTREGVTAPERVQRLDDETRKRLDALGYEAQE
jgi:arylsulfatase